MGGEQAAAVLNRIRGTSDSELRDDIKERYERQSHSYYASARLWDDGVIDPLDTRRILSLGLETTLHAPIPETRFGVFRM
jgi:3-methylcrotonyl-CoA carboxylase beta subunit